MQSPPLRGPDADALSPVEEATDIDRGVRNFFGLCALATESQCGWTTPQGSARTNATLLQKWDDWVGVNPLELNRGRPDSSPLTDTTSSNVRSLVYQSLKDPEVWPKLSNILQSWYDDASQIVQLSADDIPGYQIGTAGTSVKRQAATGNYDPNAANANDNAAPNALSGISCLDSAYRPPRSPPLSGAQYQAWYGSYSDKTIYASDLSIVNFYNCAPWITQPKEVFDPVNDRFANIQTLNPILFVQTTYDPVTPEVSGDAAAQAFSNSYIIKSNGAGVSTFLSSLSDI